MHKALIQCATAAEATAKAAELTAALHAIEALDATATCSSNFPVACSNFADYLAGEAGFEDLIMEEEAFNGFEDLRI